MGIKPDEIREISVLVKLGSRKAIVECLPDGGYAVAVRSLPIAGKANEELVRLLADYFNVPKRAVVIRSGLRSRRKKVSIKSI